MAVLIEVRMGRVSVALEGGGVLPASGTVGGAASVQTWFAYGGLVPCAHLDPFALCAVGVIGNLHAESSGVSMPSDDNALDMRAGIRVRATASVARSLLLFLDVEGHY